jgi:hypothetical protein
MHVMPNAGDAHAGIAAVFVALLCSFADSISCPMSSFADEQNNDTGCESFANKRICATLASHRCPSLSWWFYGQFFLGR